MPTIDRFGPYRVFFYMADFGEPPHVHIECDDCMLKIWLADLTVAVNRGFADHEVRHIRKHVEAKRDDYWVAWTTRFG